MSETVLYEKRGRIARITLNRPEALNAIDMHMPSRLFERVEEANADDGVHAIVLAGSGRAFCSGYDLKIWAETKGPNVGSQEMPWDPTLDYKMMKRNTDQFSSLWK